MHQVNPMLAKLLAKENLTVEHGNYKTAWFDVKNRVLGLPIWKDLGKDAYDLLVGHEVGHALYTPYEGIHSSNDEIKGCPRDYINVVEDARIERKIRETYPGLIRTFKSGYKKLFDSGLFGDDIASRIDTLKLIDKINLKAKLVDLVDIPFNDEELELYYETMNTQTFSDVCVVVKKILAYTQNQEEGNSEEEDSSPQSSAPTDEESNDSESNELESQEEEDDEPTDVEIGMAPKLPPFGTEEDSDEDSKVKTKPAAPEHNPGAEHTSETDEAFRQNEEQLLEADEFGEQALYLSDYNKSEFDQIVIPYAKLAESRAEKVGSPHNDWKQREEHYEVRSKCMAFLKEIKKNAQPAIKEFEMKKAAFQWQRASSSKTGSIDVNKLYSYKYEEDIFSRVTQMADAKNHGLMLLIDYSGSMYDIIGNVVQQTLHMVSFCKAVNIPFSVYAFTTGYDTVRVRNNVMGSDDIKMCELINSDLNKKDYEEAMYQLSLRCLSAGLIEIETDTKHRVDRAFGYASYCSRHEEFGSTPLNQALLVANRLVKKFVNKHGVQKMNFVTITDGDANRVMAYGPSAGDNTMPIKRATLRCGGTIKLQVGNKVINSAGGRDLTTQLLDNLRKSYNANTMGFFISDRNADFNYRCHSAAKQNADNLIDQLETRKWTTKEYNKNKCVEFKNVFGYDTYYMVKGGKGALNTDSTEFNPSTSRSIGNDFKKFSKSKKTNKVLMQKIGAAVA